MHLRNNKTIYESEPIHMIDKKMFQEYRKSFKMLKQLNEYQELKSYYFPEAEKIADEILQAFHEYQQSIFDSLGRGKISINRLFELRDIANQLKYIEQDPLRRRPSIFEELIQKIREKI